MLLMDELWVDYSWSNTPIARRVQVLNRIADLIEANIEEIAALESRDQGKLSHWNGIGLIMLSIEQANHCGSPEQ